MSSSNQRVAVVGLWHQGVVAAACLAEWGCDVVAADLDEARIAKLSRGEAPLFEPGLDALLGAGVQSGRLAFTSKLADAVRDRPVVLLAHDTPVNANDESDLTEIFLAVREIAPGLARDVVLHVTAQVPVGTCDEIRSMLHHLRPQATVRLAYSPENLRLGQALERYRKPPLPVLGADDDAALDRLAALYAPCGAAWMRCSLRTAEMSKHALNSFLALSVTFANELGNLCDEVGADGHRLAEILRLEPRVGPKAMLFPGLGFAGGTLARDVQTLRRLGEGAGIETPLLDGLWTSNKLQNGAVVRRLLQASGDSLAGVRVAVWGLTYKPDTSTLRRSAALEVIADLQRAGAVVTAHDPKADRAELASAVGFTFCEDPLSAVDGADALVLMTPWAQYKAADWQAVADRMKGRLVFDTANLWSAASVEGAGFHYLDIGRGRKARKDG